MNILDRAIGFFSPEQGLRRANARVVLDRARSYDGARMGRRTEGWRATNASANVTTRGALPTLRARSRDLVRNTWWGQRINRVFVSHAVGSGIMPKPNSGDKALDKQIKLAFKKWSRHCDREGQLNFDGLTALATTCIIESGEVLAHIVPLKRGEARRGVVPLELQLLEPDHLDHSRDRMMSPQAIVDQGIEYDISGKRKGYWIHQSHPGARGIVMPTASTRVDADDMLHVYRKDRIGQGRGVPWLSPVMLTGRDVADLQEAIVVKSRIEACLALFVKSNNSQRSLADTVTEQNTSGAPRRIETLAPGMVFYGEPGEEATAINPSSSMQFDSVLKTTFQALAAGCGITYDQLTGDLTRANFSSLRAGKIEFRRIVEQFQHLTLVAMFLEPLWERWLALAIDAGVLPLSAADCPVEWIMPANEPIDPMKDMQADMLAVRSGRMTWPAFVAAWGIDPDVQLDEIEAWFKEIDRRNIVLDTDPRRPSVSPKAVGQGNNEESAADEKPAKKPGKSGE